MTEECRMDPVSAFELDCRQSAANRQVTDEAVPNVQERSVPGSNQGHVSCSVQYSCGPVGCHLRRKVVEFAVSHETHNPKVGGSNPPPATNQSHH